MKIRNGFVSNSSSSSFVIVVPENIDDLIKDDDVIDFLQEQYECFSDEDNDYTLGYDTIEDKNNFLKKVREEIKNIKKYGSIELPTNVYNYDIEDEYISLVLQNFIPNKNILFDMEAGSDAEPSTIFVTKQHIINKLEKMK